MQANEWGPGAWKFLHACTFAVPANPDLSLQKSIKDYFTSLGDLLPCRRCAKHYKAFVKKYPIPCTSRDKLTRWLVALHNNVNRRRRAEGSNNTQLTLSAQSDVPYELVRAVYEYAETDENGAHVETQACDARTRGETRARAARAAITTAIVVLAVAAMAGLIIFVVRSCTKGLCPLPF